MTTPSFRDLNLSETVLSALEDMGFTQPTEIQAQAIPLLLDTNDSFVGQAQTGTGKTAAFTIPLLEKMDFNAKGVQALVLAPTRELAMQVEREIKLIGAKSNLRTTCIYGGSSYEKQFKALNQGRPHIVVGTPGRVIDLINKKKLILDDASFCILDEADEMLNMGFFEDVKGVVELFQEDSQLMMFSATMPRQIIHLIEKYFNPYQIVRTKNKNVVNQQIDQEYLVVKEKFYAEALSRIIDGHEDLYGIVFCRTKFDTRQVGDALTRRGIHSEVLNGDMGQMDRERAMKKFKEKHIQVLVCTDVAARGIDVQNLTHVFNLGLPQNSEAYVHRIGRTGRAGQTGKAITIISPKDFSGLRRLERETNNTLNHVKLPQVDTLKLKAVQKDFEGGFEILSAIKDKGSEFKTDESFDFFEEQMEGLSREEVLKFMFTWKYNQMFRHYQNLSEIEIDPSVRHDRGGRGGRSGGRSGGRGGFSRGGGGGRDGRRDGRRSSGGNSGGGGGDRRRRRPGSDSGSSAGGSSRRSAGGGEGRRFSSRSKKG